MPGQFFWGGLTQGLQQGMAQADEMRRRKEQLKLEQQKIKIQEQEAAMRAEQFKDLMLGRQKAHAIAGELEAPTVSGGELATAPTGGTVDQPDPFDITQTPRTETPAPLKNRMMAAQIYGGHGIPSEAFKAAEAQRGVSVGMGGALVDPTTGKEMYRNPGERAGVGAESRLFSQFLDEMKQAGIDDPQEIRTRWQAVLQGNASARGQGTRQGGLNVTSSPEYIQNQANIAGARQQATTENQPLPAGTAERLSTLQSLKGTLNVIRQGFNKEYLGPIKGTNLAFEGRRRVGSVIGAPLGEQETQFRQALKDAGDQLLRARSGAQINEQEYARLSATLPKATDEPQVFQAGLSRFEAEIDRISKAKTEFGTTPRKNIPGSASSGGQPAQTGGAPDGTRQTLGGKSFIKRNGQWFPE